MSSIKDKVIWDRLFRIFSKITFLFFSHSIRISVKTLVEISIRLRRLGSIQEQLEKIGNYKFDDLFFQDLISRCAID